MPDISLDDLLTIDGSKVQVPYMKYENLHMPRDWTIVLGQGLQGTVEHMIYQENPDSPKIDVAVKKTFLT
jgi:hypothetical protein